jgi:hypothetical protein
MPVEDFIFAGLQQRFTQVFGCPALLSTATDKVQVLKKYFEGRDVTYPYAYIMPETFSSNLESYNQKALSRHGLIAWVEDGVTHKVKLLPAVFEVNVEFVTDKYSAGSSQGSVLAFVRRWLFARTAGYLRFTIEYGRLRLNIGGMVLSDAIPTPQRENVLENISTYTVTSSISLRGYISEPMMIQSSVVQDIQIAGQQMQADGSLSGSQFFSFDDYRVV